MKGGIDIQKKQKVHFDSTDITTLYKYHELTAVGILYAVLSQNK